MFSFYSVRRVITRSASVLAVVLCLAAALVFTGCKMEEDKYNDDHKVKSGLIGKWAFDYEGGQELYTITATTLTYDDTYLGLWGGQIVYISNFSKDAGVLIIEYDAGKKQQWTDWDTMADITPTGNFYGVYFSELKEDSVKMANTSDQNANGGPTETETLEQAIKKFTRGKRGDYTYPGGIAQTRQN